MCWRLEAIFSLGVVKRVLVLEYLQSSCGGRVGRVETVL